MTEDTKNGFTEEVSEPCSEGAGVTLDDFVAYMPSHVYIFTPCREPWTQTSVNARLPPVPVLDKHGRPKRVKGKLVTVSASKWLDQNRPVEQMTWVPGFPMLIKNRLVVDGGWIERADVTCFNHYRAPRIVPGDASKAGPWLDHVHKIYPADAAHIIAWLAHRVQRPQEKINHALVLGGLQGIGKDTLLEPVKHAVGPWNFRDVIPANLFGRFNSFAKAVILRVNEARDLGDAERVNRFTFYDHTKTYTAAPPDVLRIDEKNLREYYVFNVLGFLITTNYKTDGIYLPADDRRHYVAWSNFTKEAFTSILLERALELVLHRRLRARRCLSRRARHLCLRSEGATAKNAGILGHRQRQHRAGRRRADGRDRQARQSRRADSQAADRRRDGRHCGLADGTQEPASAPASARALRLRLGEEPRQQARTVEAERRAAKHLRQGKSLACRGDQDRKGTNIRTVIEWFREQQGSSSRDSVASTATVQRDGITSAAAESENTENTVLQSLFFYVTLCL